MPGRPRARLGVAAGSSLASPQEQRDGGGKESHVERRVKGGGEDGQKKTKQ